MEREIPDHVTEMIGIRGVTKIKHLKNSRVWPILKSAFGGYRYHDWPSGFC
jgi:hypothetical protein